MNKLEYLFAMNIYLDEIFESMLLNKYVKKDMDIRKNTLQEAINCMTAGIEKDTLQDRLDNFDSELADK